jgi:hypothetical protein
MVDKKIVWGMGIGLMLVLALVGVYVLAGGTLAATSQAAQAGVNPTPTPGNSCPVAMNTQMTAANYAKSGSFESVTVYPYDNTGKPGASFANNTNYAVSGYYTYTFLVDGTNMFADKVTKTYGCNGNENVQSAVAEADTGATISFINTDGVTINSAANNETVVAGQSIDPTIKVKNAAQDKFVTSPYCKAYVVTVKFANVSAWDLSKSTISGCTGTSVPVAEAGASHQAFLCSAPDGVVNKFQGDIRAAHFGLLSSGDIYSIATSDRITFKVYPEDNVLNSKTGMPMGCLPENDIGTVAQTAITSGGVYYMQ